MEVEMKQEELNNIDIKIGITYPIHPKNQKCVEQVEEYKKGNKTIFSSECYRSGEFDITPRSAWEVKYLKSGLAGDDIHLEHFSDYEMHGYSDGQGLEFFGDGSERLQEAFEIGGTRVERIAGTGLKTMVGGIISIQNMLSVTV